jgi:hypothetical protein
VDPFDAEYHRDNPRSETAANLLSDKGTKASLFSEWPLTERANYSDLQSAPFALGTLPRNTAAGAKDRRTGPRAIWFLGENQSIEKAPICQTRLRVTEAAHARTPMAREAALA